MSIFGKIMGAIFGPPADAPTTAARSGTPNKPAPNDANTIAASSSAENASATPASGSRSATTDAKANVDVAAILDKAVAAQGEKLDWKRSIVDLLKALDIDSSMNARKELAKELGYGGDMSDSATMNVWLHKQVMAKLAANGGKLPPDMKQA